MQPVAAWIIHTRSRYQTMQVLFGAAVALWVIVQLSRVMGYASELRISRVCIAAVLYFISLRFAESKVCQCWRGTMQTQSCTLDPPAFPL
jgi:multisubunit Na+/H+ antiporter MnhE subunit